MYLDDFSRAKYTFPNLPRPSGFPMSKSTSDQRFDGCTHGRCMDQPNSTYCWAAQPQQYVHTHAHTHTHACHPRGGVHSRRGLGISCREAAPLIKQITRYPGTFGQSAACTLVSIG
jgi:hypothetical protein